MKNEKSFRVIVVGGIGLVAGVVSAASAVSCGSDSMPQEGRPDIGPCVGCPETSADSLPHEGIAFDSALLDVPPPVDAASEADAPMPETETDAETGD